MDIGEADVAEVSVPGKIRRERAQPGRVHLVVIGFGIAPFHARLGVLRHLRFDGQDGARLGGGFISGVAGQLQHLRDVLHVLIAKLFGFVFVLGVVVAIRQSQSALAGAADHLLAIFVILLGTKAKKHARALAVQMRHFVLKLGEIADRGDALEFRLDGLGA